MGGSKSLAEMLAFIVAAGNAKFQTDHPLFISSPKILEPVGRHCGVNGCIGNILVTEPVLQAPGIVTGISEGIPATVA
jgi:hypothetical protein